MTQAQMPDNWRSEHVFVLVGGNPLPNYIAGKLLLHSGGTLHLVHSPDTKDVAERIGCCFPRHSYIRHEIQDPANGSEVERVLEIALGECQGETVALNYTGGTKTMAVHAHRTVSRVLAKRKTQVVFTYLDAQTLSLRRDDTSKGLKVQYMVKSEIKTLLALHGIELHPKSPMRREPRRAILNQALACAHASPRGQAAYERWCQRYLRRPSNEDDRLCRKALDEVLEADLSTLVSIPRGELYAGLQLALRGSRCCHGRLVERLGHFPQTPIPFPKAPELKDVVEAMRETFEAEGDSFDPAEVVAKKEVGLKRIKDLVRYLDGDWVEHLALAAFIANKDKCNLHNWAMSLRTNKYPYDFEFDVAAMQGYQLYAVSCTRSADRGLCKSKLFEAYVRAAQLGGDEAKVGLVCCDKSPNVLQRQVTEGWRAEKGRIRVFGPQDLPNLARHFYDWLSR